MVSVNARITAGVDHCPAWVGVEVASSATVARVSPTARNLYALFAEQARQTPEAPALVFEAQRLTYAQLQCRASALADQLRALGVGPEVIVGLWLERSLEMLPAMLAVLKAGGAYLPIDPAFPRERVAFMLADAGVSVLLTQTPLASKLSSPVSHTLCLDTFAWTNGPDERPESPESPASPENLAYVIYTSGSTGQPKGVCIEHRNIVNYVSGVTERLRLERGWHYATVSTLAADLGYTAIFPALATGGCLHVISQACSENPALLADYFSREKIDVLKIVPSHLAALQAGKNPQQMMPRRRLILGGDVSRIEWIAQLQALAPACEIFNHYGPTETTVGVLTYAVGSSLPHTPSGMLPIGQPLANSHVQILDEQGQPCAPGVIGELFIGGAGVARGYLKRPELTAAKFVADRVVADRVVGDPSGAEGGRFYRSGDLARYLPDGDVEFCGRADDQVKISGYRVELGEVEKALREQPGVQDCVVLASEPGVVAEAGAEAGAGAGAGAGTGAGDRQLRAYVVPKQAHQPLWGELAVHILPDGSPVAHLNRNETDYIFHEIFVLQAYLRHGMTLESGDCILDAGANIGLFTVFASRLAEDLKIFAFEPNPSAFACLKANAEAWGQQVKCFPFGLSSENKSAEMTFFEGLSLLSGYYADSAIEHSMVSRFVANQRAEMHDNGDYAEEIDALISERLRGKSVPTQLRTLSSVIAEEGIARIDLLKVNVEKSELDLLHGIVDSDWPKIRQLVIEIDQQESIAPIQALLTAQGFETQLEQDPMLGETELCYLYARRAPLGAHSSAGAVPEAAHALLTPATLRKALKARLPHYMIPSTFVLLDQLPLNANGKIDRQALQALSVLSVASAPAAQGRDRFSLPQTVSQKKLAAIWADLLKCEGIGIDDDFFDLGGQSLSAIRMLSRIREAFDVDLPLRNLFEYPTLSALANIIDGLLWLAHEPAGKGDGREEIAL